MRAVTESGSEAMGRVTAFFDLDRTLIAGNSGLLWATHERREGNISGAQMARALFWTGLYHLSLIDMETALDYAIQHRDIVARFGRFPHRNVLLGRTSSGEEVEFLKQPGSSF